jgi:DNA-binding NarL/FixJ family response regulator
MKILIVDDHKIFRAAFIRFLSTILNPDDECIEAGNGESALALIHDSVFDVVFLDISMPIMDGYEACKQICKIKDHPSVIMLTQHEEKVTSSYFINKGVSFLTKSADPEEIASAIEFVRTGKQYLQNGFSHTECGEINIELSGQEKRLIESLQLGNSSRDIAKQMMLTTKTVDTYRERLLKKTKTKNVAELIAFAFKTGLLR